MSKCATLRLGGRYGNSVSTFGPGKPTVKSPQPPTISTVSKEFGTTTSNQIGAFGSATLDRKHNNTEEGSASQRSTRNVLERQQPSVYSIDTGTTFSRSRDSNRQQPQAPMHQLPPKTISILNQPLPEIPQSAVKMESVKNLQQPLCAASLNQYRSLQRPPAPPALPKSSFNMTSQLTQQNLSNPNTSYVMDINNINNNTGYPLKSSMKQQTQLQQQPQPQQQPQIPQHQPQMFSSINKTLPPQLPPKNRQKDLGMIQHQPQHQQQQRQTLPSSKSQTSMQLKGNSQYSTFIGFNEAGNNNNNSSKPTESCDKAKLIQQYYQETSNLRNNNVDFGALSNNQQVGRTSSNNRMQSYQTLPHQPKNQQPPPQYQQYASQPQHNYSTSGKMVMPSPNQHPQYQQRTTKMDRNSNVEQSGNYYRSLQRGSNVIREAGAANNDLYSVSTFTRVFSDRMVR